MELRSKRHRMDHDWFLIWVVIEDDDLQQSAGTIRSDHQIPTLARYHSQRTPERVFDVLIANAVLARAVRDLHLDKVTLSTAARQGSSSNQRQYAS